MYEETSGRDDQLQLSGSLIVIPPRMNKLQVISHPVNFLCFADLHRSHSDWRISVGIVMLDDLHELAAICIAHQFRVCCLFALSVARFDDCQDGPQYLHRHISH
jgi:hypothetical protein